MAFTASNLVQRIYNELGQVEPQFGLFDATGGSATTFINTSFANFENPPEQDAFKNYLAIVVRDAAGAGADPEGKWSVVSAYADASQTGTIATVTTAIAASDTIMLAKQDKFPLSQLLFAINRGLESLGDLSANASTTLTTATEQTEYAVAVALKRGLKQVWVQGNTGDANNNQWIKVNSWRVELTTAGTAAILYVPQFPADYTLRLVYDAPHTAVAAYSDTINEYVHPEVATAASIVKLLQWYNRRDENQDSDSYFLWLEQEYSNKHLPFALLRFPIPRPGLAPKYSVFSKSSAGDTVPDPI